MESSALNGRINASLYYFQVELENMIYRAGDGTQANPTHYENAGKGRILGIESALSLPLGIERLSLDATYTLTSARIIDNPIKRATEGKQLIGIPLHMINLSLNYAADSNRNRTNDSKGISGLYGSLWLYYAPAFFVDDTNSTPLENTFQQQGTQFSLNAKIGYIFSNGFDINLSVNNMTNYRYYDNFYQVAGTSLYAQCAYRY